MARTIHLEWNRTSGEITPSEGYRLKRNEEVKFIVQPMTARAPSTFATGWALTFTVKQKGNYDATPLFVVTAFSAVGDGTYTATAQVASAEIDAALEADATTTDDLAEIDCCADLSLVISAGNPEKSDTIFVTLQNCVTDEDGDGSPTSNARSITDSNYTMSTARLLGRTTASTGAIEEITVGSGLTLSGGTLTGTASSITTIAALQSAITAASQLNTDTTIDVGAAEFTISAALSASITGAGTGAIKLNLHPGTVLLYASVALATLDGQAGLFQGVRNLRNFGGVTITVDTVTPPADAVMNRNVLAFKCARASGTHSSSTAYDTGGSLLTPVHLLIDDPGRYWVNEELRLGYGCTLEMGNIAATIINYDADYAPGAGRAIAEFTTGDINATNNCITLNAVGVPGVPYRHMLAHMQRVRFTTTGTLPSPLVAGTDYWVRIGDYILGGDVNDYSKVSLWSDSSMTAASLVDLVANGSGTHTLVAMERFGIVVDRFAVSANSNTCHNVNLIKVSVGCYVGASANNAGFSGIAFRGAQNSSINDCHIVFCERALVMGDISASIVISHLNVSGYNTSGALNSVSGRPAIQFSSMWGGVMEQIFVGGVYRASTDAATTDGGYVAAAMRWSDCRNIAVDNFAVEQGSSALHLNDSHDNTIATVVINPGNATAGDVADTTGLLFTGNCYLNDIATYELEDVDWAIRDLSTYNTLGNYTLAGTPGGYARGNYRQGVYEQVNQSGTSLVRYDVGMPSLPRFTIYPQNNGTQPIATVPWLRVGGGGGDSPIINAGNSGAYVYICNDLGAGLVISGSLTVGSYAFSTLGLSLGSQTTQAGMLSVLGIETPTTTERGITKHVYVANRTDGNEGSGTAEDPFHAASTSGGIRTLLADSAKVPANSYVYLYPGTYVVATATTLAGVVASGVQLICWPGADLSWVDAGNRATDTAAGLNQTFSLFNR